MPRITIELGREEHTTSWGRVFAKINGAYLNYNQAATQHRVGDGYVLCEFDLPQGTEIELVAKGASGPKGVDRSDVHVFFVLDDRWPEREIQLPGGPKRRILKGRFRVDRGNPEGLAVFGVQPKAAQESTENKPDSGACHW